MKLRRQVGRCKTLDLLQQISPRRCSFEKLYQFVPQTPNDTNRSMQMTTKPSGTDSTESRIYQMRKPADI
ncbi:hypothetical protein HYQ44_012838 [Verticillium longisporum]|nr:hypothetical protein HYQ44_012838 [Verticillium longisporum]